MTSALRSLFFAAIAVATLLSSSRIAAAAQPAEERQLFDANWRFALGHASDSSRDFDHATSYFSYLAKAGYGDGPAAQAFDDRAWRQLDLPHDWAVELPFDPRASASHGFKAVGRNFPENSIGWYRKSFSIPAADLGRRIAVEFDGIYRNAAVWINGFYLGREPSGYLGCRYDLTDYLNYGGENVLAVRADATMEEGWFYEGAGIYRHAWLTKTGPVHLPRWGTVVSTPRADRASADVVVRTAVTNEGATPVTFALEQSVAAPDGRIVASTTPGDLRLAAGETREISSELKISAPALWSLGQPALHRLHSTVRVGDEVVARSETTFGIRTIRFDPDRGFFLNDQHVVLKGVNLHQDHAGVGVAVPDRLNDYRIARLKEFGVNAIRVAHTPPAPEFLDACDRLGVLVIDENRRMGPSPEVNGELERLIRRDRNHPSVILWSLGNEEWSIEGNIKGARIAATMQTFAQRLDPTRRTTVAISGGWGGISTVIDVVGYNYIKQSNPDQQHASFPQQPGVGTEETTTQGTRGIYFDDRARAWLSPQARGDSGGNCEIGWSYYAARPFLAGLFFWTGFDYRGEPTPFGWPAVSSQFGLLDTCGFRKDSTYYLESWWTDRPVLHLAPHWNWAGREGQPIKVVCYSNHEAVELYLNGSSLGKKDLPRNGHLEWSVPYSPGTLEARGYREGRVVGTTRVETTGAPTELMLTPDRPDLAADGVDVTVFTVSARDAAGRAVPIADQLVEFKIAGGRIIGVGNGDPGSREIDKYSESLSLVPIQDWRGRIAPAGTIAPAASTTLDPFPKLGNWRAPKPQPGELYDLAATFTLDVPAPGTVVTLVLPSFGAKTTVWLNGHELAHGVDTALAGPLLTLDPSQLAKGENRLQLIVVPFGDGRNHIPELTRLGSIRLASPAPAARRHLFNGLAQVIVQAGREAGEIRLTATAEGLATAESKISTH